MRFPGLRFVAIAAFAAALTTSAMAQEWRVTPAPLEVRGIITCSMGFNHPDYFLSITLSGDTPALIIKSPSLVGIQHGTSDSVISLPAGSQSRVTLIKDETDGDIAMVEIRSDADLYAMIDGFAVSGNFSVVVLGGRPTAFRLPSLAEAADEGRMMKNCIEEFYYG